MTDLLKSSISSLKMKPLIGLDRLLAIEIL